MTNNNLTDSVISINTKESFKNLVIENNQPILIDFWAEWCHPCRALAPIIEEISILYKNQIKVYKINIDENPDIAHEFTVRSIPTLILFNNSRIVGRATGFLQKEKIINMIDEKLSLTPKKV